MKRFLVPLVLTLATAAPGAQALPDSGILLDSYAAIVNGRVITVGEVLAALQPLQERLAAQYDGPELAQKLNQEFDATRASLIESQLILLDFGMQGGTLPDRAIEDHVNSVIHDRFQNDRTAFLRALAAERLTFSEWRKQMKDQLIVQIMRQKEVASKILVAPFDLQTAYNQKRTTFILPERVRLRTLALPATTTRSGTSKIRNLLLAGKATFEQAAVKGATLQDDGEFIETTSLEPAIRVAIAPLSPGGISEPVEIGGIRYLIELVERQSTRIRSFDEVSPEIGKNLRRAEFERLNKIWIDSLRAKYYVQTFSHNLFD